MLGAYKHGLHSSPHLDGPSIHTAAVTATCLDDHLPDAAGVERWTPLKPPARLVLHSQATLRDERSSKAWCPPHGLSGVGWYVHVHLLAGATCAAGSQYLSRQASAVQR